MLYWLVEMHFLNIQVLARFYFLKKYYACTITNCRCVGCNKEQEYFVTQKKKYSMDELILGYSMR